MKLHFSSHHLILSYTFLSLSWQYPAFSNALDDKNDKLPYLSCPVVKERSGDFLKNHYVFRSFDTTLSERTFRMYFKMLDPRKVYFLQSDIDSFGTYEKILGRKIQNVDCRFITDVYNLYKKRVQESTQVSLKLLSESFDFSKDEFLETNSKKTEWAKTTDELRERTRKTLKFIILNMKETETLPKITERLTKRYQLILKDVDTRSDDDINSIFLNAFAQSLDPHSSFLTPSDNDEFQIDFSLKLVGIGATLTSTDGYTTVESVVPGGAAFKDGRLKKGDKIISVDPGDGRGVQDVIDLELSRVVQLIRGKEGSTVKLTVLRKVAGGETTRIPIHIVRAVVQIKDSEAKSDVMTIRNKKIGVINLPSFYIDYKGCQENPSNCRSSSNDMAREVLKLKKQHVDGIVIDLRRNGGGDLSEVQKMTGLFLTDPVVTQVEDKSGQVRPLGMNSKSLYDGPLSILVSKYTASASEIISGALQDYGRGLVVGDSRTFGKGTVQTVIEIPGTDGRQSNGAIHVTVAKFFRPSGKSNQEKGILSDVVIPDVVDATDTGEAEADYALPYTTIKPSREFAPIQDLHPILEALHSKSSARIQESSSFKKVQENMQKVRAEQNSLVSLKEKADKKETLKKNSSKKEVAQKDHSLSASRDDAPDFSLKVIDKNDLSLKEAGEILVDAMELLNHKKDWTRHDEHVSFNPFG